LGRGFYYGYKILKDLWAQILARYGSW